MFLKRKAKIYLERCTWEKPRCRVGAIAVTRTGTFGESLYFLFIPISRVIHTRALFLLISSFGILTAKSGSRKYFVGSWVNLLFTYEHVCHMHDNEWSPTRHIPSLPFKEKKKEKIYLSHFKKINEHTSHNLQHKRDDNYHNKPQNTAVSCTSPHIARDQWVCLTRDLSLVVSLKACGKKRPEISLLF